MKSVKGFTLVELVIVIAIIGVLAGLAIPHFLDSQAKTRSARAAADMRILQSAIEQYMAAGNSITNLTDNQKTNAEEIFPKLVEKGFLDSVPTAPRGDYYFALTSQRISFPDCSYGIESSADANTPGRADRNITVSFINGYGTSGSGIPYTIFIENYILGQS